MPRLNTTDLPQAFGEALLDSAQRTQEPLALIVSKALAEYLRVPPHTLYPGLNRHRAGRGDLSGRCAVRHTARAAAISG